MNLCTHVYTYICTYIYICVYIHILHIHVHIHKSMYTSAHSHIICICMYTHVYPLPETKGMALVGTRRHSPDRQEALVGDKGTVLVSSGSFFPIGDPNREPQEYSRNIIGVAGRS